MNTPESTFATVLAVAILAAAPFARASRPPTLMVNEDAWSFRSHHGEADMTEDGLRRYVDRFAAGGKVTHVLFCVNAMHPAYPSAVTEPEWLVRRDNGELRESKSHVFRDRFYAKGIDPYRVWIARCREKGIKPWISMRVNDVHFITNGKESSSTYFWRKHPELRRRPDQDPAKVKWPWTDYAFNFAREEVRDHHFALFREIADRYDADGFELDTLRFTRHLTPGKEREEAPLMTEFIRRCRDYLRRLSKERGREIQLSARVPTSYAAALSIGLDAEAWARENLVDWVIVCNFFDQVDYDFDFAGWKRRIAAANPRTAVLPGATDCIGGEPYRLDIAAYRGWADEMYAQGADGLYLYNTTYLNDADVIFGDGLASDGVRKGSRRYVRTRHDVTGDDTSADCPFPAKLDADREFTVRSGRGANADETAEVVIGLVKDGPAPRVSLNGVEPTGAAMREEMGFKYMPEKRMKAAWRYRFPAGAAKSGANVVTAHADKAAQGEAPSVCWCEIDFVKQQN